MQEYYDNFVNRSNIMGVFNVSGEHTFVRLASHIFTARCTIVQSAILQSHVVCLSVSCTSEVASAQKPLRTFPRNFPIDGEVANLLATSRCN